MPIKFSQKAPKATQAKAFYNFVSFWSHQQWLMDHRPPGLEPLPVFARAVHPLGLDAPQRAAGRYGGAQLPQQAPQAKALFGSRDKSGWF
jgi:hypothetical protein